jgi:hypothetical protein
MATIHGLESLLFHRRQQDGGVRSVADRGVDQTNGDGVGAGAKGPHTSSVEHQDAGAVGVPSLHREVGQRRTGDVTIYLL